MHDVLLWFFPSETQLNALTKSGLLRGTLSASEQLALISGTDKIEEACRDAKHVQVKSLPIETDFKCSLTVAGLELRNSARVLVPHFRGKHFWRSSSKTRGVCLSLLLSLKRGVGHSNVLVRLIIPAFSVCFLFYRYLRDDFDEDRLRMWNIFWHHEFSHKKFF